MNLGDRVLAIDTQIGLVHEFLQYGLVRISIDYGRYYETYPVEHLTVRNDLVKTKAGYISVNDKREF